MKYASVPTANTQYRSQHAVEYWMYLLQRDSPSIVIDDVLESVLLATVFEMEKNMPRKVTATAPETAAQPEAPKKGKVGRPRRAAYTGSLESLLSPRENVKPSEESRDDATEEQEESGERKVEGKRLITLIKRTLIDRNLPDRYIADLMGVTTIYWNSMCNGHRKIKSVGKDKLERVGEFLGIPTVQVMILADYFEPTDFYAKRSLKEELDMVLEAMLGDPNWVSLSPTRAEWNEMPVNTKVLIALLYEREAGRSFMSKLQMEHPALAKKLGMEDQKN
jgi:transcriptional regulator with XRE-family HTH domain